MSSVDFCYTIIQTQTNTWLTREITQRVGGSDTYDLDAMAWSGGEDPGAGLFAGISIRPVWAGDDSIHAIHSVITARCKKTALSQHRPLYHLKMKQPDCNLTAHLPDSCSDYTQ